MTASRVPPASIQLTGSGAPAAARSFVRRPGAALGLSVVIALATVWVAIAAAYDLNLPVGFFVGVLSACSYALGRGWAAWRRHSTRAG